MYHLIIVDDEPEILAGLCTVVRWNDLGFNLKAAFSSGIDARNYLSTHTCDVLLCDIVMNNISGLDLAEYVKANHPRTYVVLNSAYEKFEYAKRAIEARVYRYLNKPTRIEEIVNVFTEIRRELDAAAEAAQPAPEAAPTNEHHIVRKVRTYVSQHLCDSFSLSEMAHELHYNPSYLSRVFKSECSEGINEYINRARIEMAQNLLLNSEMKIYEISDRVGFHDIRYFTRQFSAFTGENPSEYRKKRRT